MKLHPTSLALAIATTLGSLGSLPANAALVTTTTAVAFDISASVTDGKGGGATNKNNASLGTSSINQFDPDLGVLVGAKLNLSNSTHRQTTQVNVADGPDNGNDNSVTSNGTGSSAVAIGAPGVSNTFSTLVQVASCSANRLGACAGAATASASATDWAGSVPSGALGSYIGAHAVTVTRTASTLTASQSSNAFTGEESTTSTVKWDGDLSATYDYLLHAAPSFAGDSSQLTLDLDFGTVLHGAAVTPWAFSIFNAAGDRVALDLDEVLPSGASGVLTTDLALFSNLGEGGSNAFQAFFDTSTVGNFAATYALTLSDADVGAEFSRWKDYSLTLNLTGTVTPRQAEPPTNGVPEPATLALVGAGLLGLTLGRRRQRRA